MTRKAIDRAKLLEVLRTVPPGGGYAALKGTYRAADPDGPEFSLVTLRRTVHDLRQEGVTDWGADDARLRPAALTTQLMKNSGLPLGKYHDHTFVQYLRTLDRGDGGRRGAGSFEEKEKLGVTHVVDLRADADGDGEPYIRTARPWEVGHLVAQPPPAGEGA